MPLNEGPDEAIDRPALTMEYIDRRSGTIFTAEEINQLLNLRKTFLADFFELLPPFCAELQEVGEDIIVVYFKNANGDFKEITFQESSFIPKEELIRELNNIGFTIESGNRPILFGIPARDAKYLLMEKRYYLAMKPSKT